MPHTNSYKLAKKAKSRVENTSQSQKHNKVSLYEIQLAVNDILNDYESTAQTLDAITAEIDGIEATNHASNVQLLKENLLSELGVNGSITAPWEREGYDSKQAWLKDQ
jgi:hypothetical protein